MEKKRVTKKITIILLSIVAVVVIIGVAYCCFQKFSAEKGTVQEVGTSDRKDGGTPPEGSPPAKPDGEQRDTPPDMQGGGMGENTSVTLQGAYTADGEEIVYDGSNDSAGLISSESDQNAVLSTNGGAYTITNGKISKTGDTTSADNSNFYGVNAILAASEGARIYLTDSALTSSSEGSNGIFATGSDTKIFAKNITIDTTKNSSRGLDATYEGTIIATDVNITTQGEHCAAVATDRGNGYISLKGGKLKTAGQGSPVIYSTGTIEVNHITGEATGAQLVGMEGLNTVRIKNSSLTGSASKASESIANGVILYQSTSGDSSTGTADFEVSDSTFTSKISNGAMFYVTNTDADIVLSNVTLDFDDSSNVLLMAAGNDASNGWGSAGSNGGNVTFSTTDQKLKGDISCDGISNVTCYFMAHSKYTGGMIEDTTYTGEGGISVNLSGDSKWIVTKDSNLVSLSIVTGAKIVDKNGKTVTIKTSDGKTVVKGTGNITVTTQKYSKVNKISGANKISKFTVDRSETEESLMKDLQ